MGVIRFLHSTRHLEMTIHFFFIFRTNSHVGSVRFAKVFWVLCLFVRFIKYTVENTQCLLGTKQCGRN